MTSNHLMQVIQFLINDKVDEAIEATKQYYISKMQEIMEDAESGISSNVRKDYMRSYHRHYNRHMNRTQAEEDAYNDIMRHHGKETHDKLKEYHRTHLKEQELIAELSKKLLRSYHSKAVDDVEDKAYNLGAMQNKSSKAFDKAAEKLDKRKKNVSKAVQKMTKEDVDSLNEIASKTLGSEVVGTEHTHEVVDGHTGKVVGKYKSHQKASRAADKKDLQYGAIRYHARPIKKGA